MIVTAVALIMQHLAYILGIVVIGFPLIGGVSQIPENKILTVLFSIITLMALNAIYLLMSMLIHSKSNGSVAIIIMSIILVVGAAYIASLLREPEYYDEYGFTFVNESGEEIEEFQKREKNPNYIEGTKREVYQFLFDFLPGGQMYQIANGVPLSTKHPLYSGLIIVVATAGGVILFRKKDIN